MASLEPALCLVADGHHLVPKLKAVGLQSVALQAAAYLSSWPSRGSSQGLVPKIVEAQQHSLYSTHLGTACDPCLLMAQHMLQQLCTAVGGSMCMHHRDAALPAAILAEHGRLAVC